MLARAAGAARPVPSRAEAAQVTRQARTAAAPPDGETQLLHLLLLRPEARFAGLALDPDVFEDTTNRRLFEAWCSDESLTVTPSPLVGEGGGEGSPLDDDVVERLTALRASATGTWDPASIDAKHIAPRVEEIARLLRLRRAQSRLVPAALAHATEVAQARRAGTEDTDALTAEFAEMDARQRALSRRARGYVEETVPTDAS
jgi:hypothetical protein